VDAVSGLFNGRELVDRINKSTIKLIEKLKSERDEMQLQLHLAKEDLADDWEAMEAKWETLENKLSAAQQEAARSADDVGDAVEILVGEIKQAYKRIKSRL